MDAASLVISLLALVVAIASAIASWRTAARQAKLQEQSVKTEDARERDRLKAASSAQLVASITWEAKRAVLSIANLGKAAARNIRVTLDEQPLLAHPLVDDRNNEEVAVLGAGAAARYLLDVSLAVPPLLLLTVRIEWNDDSTEPGRWESELKLF